MTSQLRKFRMIYITNEQKKIRFHSSKLDFAEAEQDFYILR